MDDEDALESTTLAQRTVLACLLQLSAAEETPATSAEIRAAAANHVEETGGEAIRISEADVMRALNGLAEAGIVEEHEEGETSPVGKGRHRYALSVDETTLGSVLEDDSRVNSLL
ncbi:MAG: hypothetical protein PPP58_02950 [Natronomonas sp.]